MANKNPKLTVPGVVKLIDHLMEDLAAVQECQKIGTDEKSFIGTTISRLVRQLLEVIVNPELIASPGWEETIAPLFEELTPRLAPALRFAQGSRPPGDDPNDRGACRYDDMNGVEHCFQTTRADCADVGRFEKDGTCP